VINHKNIAELFMAGRHYRLFVLIKKQYSKKTSPTLRGNNHYCFVRSFKVIGSGEAKSLISVVTLMQSDRLGGSQEPRLRAMLMQSDRPRGSQDPTRKRGACSCWQV